MTWYTEVPNQNNPADVAQCWSALLMVVVAAIVPAVVAFPQETPAEGKHLGT